MFETVYMNLCIVCLEDGNKHAHADADMYMCSHVQSHARAHPRMHMCT